MKNEEFNDRVRWYILEELKKPYYWTIKQII